MSILVDLGENGGDEEIYGRTYWGGLSQLETSEIMGVSERSFRRARDRYEAAGARIRINALCPAVYLMAAAALSLVALLAISETAKRALD